MFRYLDKYLAIYTFFIIMFITKLLSSECRKIVFSGRFLISVWPEKYFAENFLIFSKFEPNEEFWEWLAL